MRRALVAVLLLASCLPAQVPVRASAGRHLAPERLQAAVAAPPERTVRLLVALFAERGLRLVNTVDAKDGRVYVFKGDRTSVTVVRGAGGVVSGESNEIGSWFAARVTGADGRSTVTLLGKPTVRGQEVCSDEDKGLADVQYWCLDTKVREDYPRQDLLDGRAEAETAVGVLERLRMLAGAAGSEEALVAAAGAPPAGTVRLAVLALRGGEGFSEKALVTLEESLQQALAATRRFAVVGRSDIASLLGLERQRQFVGCGDAACVAEIAGALGVGYLAAGDVGRVGDARVLNLKIIDVKTASVAARARRTVQTDAELLPALDDAAKELAAAFAGP
jgi:TolB-like protein